MGKAMLAASLATVCSTVLIVVALLGTAYIVYDITTFFHQQTVEIMEFSRIANTAWDEMIKDKTAEELRGSADVLVERIRRSNSDYNHYEYDTAPSQKSAQPPAFKPRNGPKTVPGFRFNPPEGFRFPEIKPQTSKSGNRGAGCGKCGQSDTCPPGPAGPPGEPGLDGEPGDNGRPGQDGLSGAEVLAAESLGYADGSNCIKCPAGEPGPKGPDGEVGVPGPDGTDGVPGLPGVDGQPGPVGLPGFPGLSGIPGLSGPVGPPGNNAIRYISAPGPRGPTGEPGRPGRPGPPGKDGEPGFPGHPGFEGQPGKDGQPGLDGMPGEPGDVGPTGDDAGYCPCPRRSQKGGDYGAGDVASDGGYGNEHAGYEQAPLNQPVEAPQKNTLKQEPHPRASQLTNEFQRRQWAGESSGNDVSGAPVETTTESVETTSIVASSTTTEEETTRKEASADEQYGGYNVETTVSPDYANNGYGAPAHAPRYRNRYSHKRRLYQTQ